MVKKRGLGKPLDALLVGSFTGGSDVGQRPDQSKERLSSLAVDLIQRGKYQPRRTMDPESLEELAASIRAQGIIQPIVVRQLTGGRYEIVAGERRWRAAQLAGLTEVPALVRDIPDEAAVAIALIENIQRESLNPIEEGIALQRLLEEFSMTHQQVAEAVGKSRATVTNLLRLQTLAEPVKLMLEQGDLEMGHARSLLTLSENLQIEAAQHIMMKGLSVREAEEMVRRLQLPKLPHNTSKPPVDPDVTRLQQDLSRRLRLAVSINYNVKGKGKLTVQYNNLEELETLLEYLQPGQNVALS
jgi:ParB family chromosome partitioning protein